MSLTCPAAPAGVSHIRSNQPKTVFVQETIKKQQSFRKEPLQKNLDEKGACYKNKLLFTYTDNNKC
jgi:hypothetical protein